MATLNGYVHVTDGEGVTHVFGPADEVPEWAQERITNPKAWAVAPTAKRLSEPEPTPVPAPKPATKRAAPRRKAATGGTVRSE
jgi:hypothetical protein